MFDTLFIGLSISSILLLVSLGLAVTYGAMGIINMAHGEMVMIGAYVAVLIKIWIGANIYFAIPVAFLVTALIGLAIEKLVVRRLYGRLLDTLLATFGIAILLQQMIRLEFGLSFFGIHIEGLGTGLQNLPMPDELQGTMVLFGQELNIYRLFIIVMTIVLTLMTWFVLYKTQLGMKVRAIIQTPQIASACGIDVKRTNAITFALGSGLAGVAGVFLAGFKTVSPDMGATLVIDGFMVVVTGGVGSLLGTVAASGLLGELNAIVATGYNDIVGRAAVFAVVICVILVKPSGLFSFKGR
ncbi:urea ABC transporter permease subunit UrtB [Roseibium algae]|uniref:Urea ABC transporter permease subunit UrtB n=1 Tax=Roseibium algae TaxID=3123038 RepID=A0ABU8TRZ9_9HYPH